jgi:hypothetical protein
MKLIKDVAIAGICAYVAIGMANIKEDHGLQPTHVGPPLAPITTQAPRFIPPTPSYQTPTPVPNYVPLFPTTLPVPCPACGPTPAQPSKSPFYGQTLI